MSVRIYEGEVEAYHSRFAYSTLAQLVLMTDEGHVASNKLSNAMQLARDLSIERRWIVSGSTLLQPTFALHC